LLVLYILSGLAVLLFIALWIPVETRMLVDTSGERKFSLRVSWFFGLLHRDLNRPGKTSRKERPGKEKKSLITTLLEGDITSRISLAGGIFRRFRELALDIYRQLKIGEVSGDFTVGLEDPALTGLLFAVVGPVNAVLNQHPRYNVNIYPYFDDETILEGNLTGRVRIRPIGLVIPTVKFLSSRDVIRTTSNFFKQKVRGRR
jgi:hypothetical protein